MTRLGFLAIGRSTFDTTAAGILAQAAFVSASASFEVVGSAALLTDVESVAAATRELGEVNAVVIVQATFTDSTLPGAVADVVSGLPLILWGIPEERRGARLLLNSLCGINLAAHHLSARGVDVRWLYEFPGGSEAGGALGAAVSAAPDRAPLPEGPFDAELSAAISALSDRTIGLVGDHPAGFEPCGYAASDLQRAGGVRVDRIELPDLFERARRAEASTSPIVEAMVGLDQLDSNAVRRSLQLHAALADLGAVRRWDAVATRCWPECFDDYGAAACTAQSLLVDGGIPATCEADVLGAATALAFQEMTGGPAFVADLVDIDRLDGTAAFWHCGIAPSAMAHPDEPVVGARHPNRGLPLINQFRLRPGRVVVGRISRTGVVWHTTGEVLDVPRPYHGTSGVVRLDMGAEPFLAAVMTNGLDHHYALAYV
jgi:hypothetical protein